ncbi:hypothetical protein G6F57_020043 [Rhizopus arrhizus]|nr:hypothetical protein G6F57_020043 [Rhizopus arrhizus]
MHQLRVVRVRQLDAAQVQDVVGTVAGANGRDGAVGSDRQRSLVRHVDGAALIGQHRLAQRGLQQAVDADLQAAAPGIGFALRGLHRDPAVFAGQRHIQVAARGLHGAHLEAVTGRGRHRRNARRQTHPVRHRNRPVQRDLLAKARRVHVGHVVGERRLMLSDTRCAIHGGVDDSVHCLFRRCRREPVRLYFRFIRTCMISSWVLMVCELA